MHPALEDHLPLIPEPLLRAHKVHEACDTRFRAAARLKQALWREGRGLPIGYHRPAEGRPRKLGSRLSRFASASGGNFLSPEIARLTYREQAYRELGAFIDEDRLWSNLLSSMPLTFNLFGALKLAPAAATAVMQALFPDLITTVDAIAFEHSPGRGFPQFTADGTAFDVVVRGRDAEGQRTFIAIEVKYSESMWEPASTHRGRYDELSSESELYTDPAAPDLRKAPLQQLWREHMLAASMVGQGLYSRGAFLVVAPAANIDVQRAVMRYEAQLSGEPGPVGFLNVTLERLVELMSTSGLEAFASELHDRYCDFTPVHDLI